jgi:hypothetical protein
MLAITRNAGFRRCVENVEFRMYDVEFGTQRCLQTVRAMKNSVRNAVFRRCVENVEFRMYDVEFGTQRCLQTVRAMNPLTSNAVFRVCAKSLSQISQITRIIKRESNALPKTTVFLDCNRPHLQSPKRAPIVQAFSISIKPLFPQTPKSQKARR